MLPPWRTRILELKRQEVDSQLFQIKLLIQAKTVENVKQWIEQYQEQTLCTYYIRDTPPCTGRYLIFKQRLNCHHNTKTWNLTERNDKRKRRNTNCPSFIKISLQATTQRKRKKARLKMPDEDMPCEIVLVPTHNHEVNTSEALSWRRVSEDVKQKLIDLYERGHNASTAREIIKMDICLNDNYKDILADRKFCPDYNYCYNLYRRHFKNRKKIIKDDISTEDVIMQDCLIKYLEEFNDYTNDDSCRFFSYDNNYIIW